MANTHSLFQKFNDELLVLKSKKDSVITSRENLRDIIKTHFARNHSNYHPSFWIQGSWKMNTTIRTKEDTCDLDDGVYFDSNPDNVTPTTLQSWVGNAVHNVTGTSIKHKSKCITVDYKAGYNIDLPVYLFKDNDTHPRIAIKNEDWRPDDPQEMVEAFEKAKGKNEQLLRIVKYLKAWYDHKREEMPCGLAMTILAMNHAESNDRDDIALKYTLINIERELLASFECSVPATPYDDLFKNYAPSKKDNFLANLANFIEDAKTAVDEEKNLKIASDLWKKHLGKRFPIGEDKDESPVAQARITPVIGSSRPYRE